jgi:hypothetical protein
MFVVTQEQWKEPTRYGQTVTDVASSTATFEPRPELAHPTLQTITQLDITHTEMAHGKTTLPYRSSMIEEHDSGK